MSLLLRLHVRCATRLHELTSAISHAAHAPTDVPTDASAHGRGHGDRARVPRDGGQATTEYALVMLGAAVVALLVVSWATAGGGAGKIGRLFDRVIDAVAGKI